MLLTITLAQTPATDLGYLLHENPAECQQLKAFLEDRSFEEIVGMDVSYRSLDMAQERLGLDRLPPRQRDRIRLYANDWDRVPTYT